MYCGLLSAEFAIDGGLLMGRARSALSFRSIIAFNISSAALLVSTAAAQTQQHNFDIGAGDLQGALARYAAVTGEAIDLQGLDVGGLQTKGVRGTLAPEAALRQLLAGTKLKSCRLTATSLMVIAHDKLCPQAAASGNSDEIVVTSDPVSHLAATNSTGTRTDADPLTLPMAVSTVNGELLRRQQSLTLADAVSNIAGVATLNDGSFTLRGFGLGTMHNGNASVDQNADDLPNIAISRLEVVKGPEAIIAGVSAGYGGVLNVITKTPPSKPTAEITSTIGTRGYYDLGADLGGPLTKDGMFAARIVGSTKGSGHNIAGYDGASNDYLAPSLTFRNPAWGTQITGQFEYQRFRSPPQLIVFTDRNELTSDLPFVRTGPESDGARVEKRTATITADQKLIGTWSLSLKYQHEYRKQNATNNTSSIISAFGYPFPNVMSFGAKVEGTVTLDTFKAELRGKVTTGPITHNLLLAYDNMNGQILQGSQLTSISTTNTLTGKITDLTPIFGRIFGIPTRWITGGVRPLQTGELILDHMEWDNLYVLAGWRRMSYNPKNINQPLPEFNKSLPSLGILYRITPELSVYGSAARAFTPNLGNYNISGSSVPPEDAEQYEAGLKALLFDRRVAATLSLYRIKQKNVAIPDPANMQPICAGGTVCYVSVPGVRSTGAELELSGNILPRLELRANYSYDDKSVTAEGGSGLAYAHHTGSLWASYHFSSEEGLGPWAGVGMQARSKRISLDPLFTAANPGNLRVDLSAGFDARKWSFIAGVKNVADARLYTISSGASGAATVVQPREVYTTIRYHFR